MWWLYPPKTTLPVPSAIHLGSNFAMYSTLVLIRTLFLSASLRNMDSAREVVRHAVQALFPAVLDTLLDRILSNKLAVPSKSTISRGLFSLDVALMVMVRDHTDHRVLRFGWADSSPTAGFDFLLSAHDEMFTTDIVRAAAAVNVLCEQRKDRVAGRPVDEGVARSNMATVYQSLRRYNDIPAAMGKGASSTEHKCAALLHKWFLMCGSEARLLRYRSSYACFCTDLGVESAAPDFHVSNVKALLPAWLHTGDVEHDVHTEGENEDCNLDIEADVACSDDEDIIPSLGDGTKFLPLAITIPGILHLINNLTKEVSINMAHWSIFHGQLKCFVLLWLEGRIDRYLEFCLAPSEFAGRRSNFDIKLGHLYEARWSEVIKLCRKLSALLPVMRLTWDEGRFIHGGDGMRQASGEEFSPQRLTETLKDPLFHGYFRMILRLHGIVEGLGGWCEGCPCHGDELAHDRRQRKRPRIAPSAAKRACPMKGKNLVGLVTGKLVEHFDQISQESTLNLAMELRARLSQEQWGIIDKDLQYGKAAIRVGLEVKFDWVKRLPWCLAALASTNTTEARACGKRAVAMYDSQSDAVRRLHHVVTKRFLDKGGEFRWSLDKFIAGAPITDFPNFQQAVLTFVFMPIAERYIEGGHSVIKRRTMGRQWKGRSAVQVSLARRLPAIIAQVAEEPSLLTQVSAVLSRTRKQHDIPKLLGMMKHPEIIRIMSSKPLQRHKLESCLRQVIYRTDTAGMMCAVGEARRDNAAAKRREGLEADRALRTENKVTAESVRKQAFIEHFHMVASENPQAYFSLPRPEGMASGLQRVTDLMRAPAVVQDLRTSFDEDAEADLLEPQADEQPHLIVRVVKSKPSAWHTVPMSKAASKKLTAQDMAVTVHRGVPTRNGEALHVSAEPLAEYPVAILRGFGGSSMAELEGTVSKWSTHRRPTYHIDCWRSCLATPDDCSRVLTDMVECGALPGPSHGDTDLTGPTYSVDESIPGATLALDELRDADYVKRIVVNNGNSEWVLTLAGVHSMVLKDRSSLGYDVG